MNLSNEDLDEITAIQLIALKNLDYPDQLTYFRKLARWFSKEFSTNYFEVTEKMTLHELLLHRYEWILENSDPKQIARMRKELLHAQEVEQKEAEDDDWIDEEIAQLKKEEKELEEQNKKKQSEEMPPDISMKF